MKTRHMCLSDRTKRVLVKQLSLLPFALNDDHSKGLDRAVSASSSDWKNTRSPWRSVIS